VSEDLGRKAVQPLPVSAGCFVCGRDNLRGLRLRFARHGEHEVRAPCVLERDFNGFSTRAHGGVVASVLDEAMGWAAVLAAGAFTYTVELNLRYRLPVPIGEPLEVRGRVARNNRRLILAEGELCSATGAVLATASGKFIAMPAAESRTVADALLYQPGDWRPAATD
jgi:acyl-coenzyme A thioesterase PaaI-like protein